jgi:hypothetical protein
MIESDTLVATMTARTSTLSIAAVFVLVAPACGGDDSEQKRVEAAEWCRVTERIDSKPDWDPVIDYDLADEWIASAPADIRAMTEQAARIRRQLAKDPKPAALVEAERDIATYKDDNCPKDTSEAST